MVRLGFVLRWGRPLFYSVQRVDRKVDIIVAAVPGVSWNDLNGQQRDTKSNTGTFLFLWGLSSWQVLGTETTLQERAGT